MKILKICNKPPFPPKDGGAIGMNNVILGLANHDSVNIDVIAVNTPKHFTNIADLPKWYIEKTNIEFVFIDTELNILSAFLNLFSKKSYNISRFISKKLKEVLLIKLNNNKYDFIQLESIYLAPYLSFIRNHCSAKVILRAPNVEHIIWTSLASEEKNPLKKLYLKMLSRRLKKYEEQIILDFDAIYTVSKKDLEYFKSIGFNRKIDFIPTGVDINKNIDFDIDETIFPTIFHIGALDWLPNQEGLKWFLDKVWPDIYNEIPDCQFHIAGRRPPNWINNLNLPNVIVHGEVDDAAEFIKKYAIMIVPLFSGSGMRVKIIEGMIMGRAIITTSIGAESLKVTDGEDILIADNEIEFKSKLIKICKSKNSYLKMSTEANKSALTKYSNETLTNKLLSFLKSL